MAKARLVIADQNSAELDAMRRSFNSLILVLERVCTEAAASTITATQAFDAIADALSTGVDIDSGSHVGTLRQVVGIRPQPAHPSRHVESVTELVSMSSSDKF